MGICEFRMLSSILDNFPSTPPNWRTNCRGYDKHIYIYIYMILGGFPFYQSALPIRQIQVDFSHSVRPHSVRPHSVRFLYDNWGFPLLSISSSYSSNTSGFFTVILPHSVRPHSVRFLSVLALLSLKQGSLSRGRTL